MTYKKTIMLFILLLCFLGGYGQKIDSDSLVNAIKKDVTTFFIVKKILDKNIVNDNLNYVLITEINKNKVLGFDKSGIYVLKIFQSHSEKHILIKEESNYKIIDVNSIDELLRETIDFSIRNKLAKNEMLSYLKIIIQIYDDNYNHNYTTFDKK